jgi:hypothetical protein
MVGVEELALLLTRGIITSLPISQGLLDGPERERITILLYIKINNSPAPRVAYTST